MGKFQRSCWDLRSQATRRLLRGFGGDSVLLSRTRATVGVTLTDRSMGGPKPRVNLPESPSTGPRDDDAGLDFAAELVRHQRRIYLFIGTMLSDPARRLRPARSHARRPADRPAPPAGRPRQAARERAGGRPWPPQHLHQDDAHGAAPVPGDLQPAAAEGDGRQTGPDDDRALEGHPRGQHPRGRSAGGAAGEARLPAVTTSTPRSSGSSASTTSGSRSGSAAATCGSRTSRAG